MPAPDHHGEVIPLIDNALDDLGSGHDASRPASLHTLAEHLCPKPMSARLEHRLQAFWRLRLDSRRVPSPRHSRLAPTWG
jgi:hypothetical protein